jgi:hypothetical protein
VPDWTPTAGLSGLELRPRYAGGIELATTDQIAVLEVPSTVTEAVTEIAIPFADVIDNLTVLLDVYNKAQLSVATTSIVYRVPSIEGSTNWSSSDGGAPQADDLDGAGADYAVFHAGGGAFPKIGTLRPNYTPQSTLGPGAWVMDSVEFRTKFTVVNAALPYLTLEHRMFWRVPGSIQTWQPQNPTTTWIGEALTGNAPFGTVTGELVTKFTSVISGAGESRAVAQIDLDALADPADALSYVDIYAYATTLGQESTPTSADQLRVGDHRIVVNYSQDPRLHSETVNIDEADAIDGVAWKTFAMTPTFSKAAGVTYLLALRKQTGSGAAIIPLVELDEPAPGGLRVYEGTSQPSGIIPAAIGIERTAMAGAAFLVSGVASVDSQPYATVTLLAVDADHEVVFEFIADGAGSYAWARITAASARPVVPDDDLTVELRNGTTVLATAVLPVWLLADAPFVLQDLDIVFPAAQALVNGTEYNLRLTSPGSAAGRGWTLAALDAGGAPSAALTRGYGGTTQRTNGDDDLDLAAVVGQSPTAPTGFAATPAGVDPVELTWNATALGSAFARYVVQRQADDGTWDDIASVTNESSPGYADKDARPGVVETYRVGVERTNGARSPWSTTDTALRAAGTARLEFPHSSHPALTVRGLRPLRIGVQQPSQIGWASDGSGALPAVGRIIGRTFSGELLAIRSMSDPAPLTLADEILAALEESSSTYATLLTPDGGRAWVVATTGQAQMSVPHHATVAVDLHVVRSRPLAVTVI